MKILTLFYCLLLCSCGKDRITQDSEKRLRPVIAYMETFIQAHHRLPTQNGFRTDTASPAAFFILRASTDPYANAHGCHAPTDYMVGSWRGEWFHYYKSWDQSFLNASDEFPLSDRPSLTR